MSAVDSMVMIAEAEKRNAYPCDCGKGVKVWGRRGFEACSYVLRLFAAREGRLPELGPWTDEPEGEA